MPFVEINGAHIHYQAQGDDDPLRTPLLLVHGSTIDSHTNWDCVLPALAEHYRVFAPDCRGHGRSNNPHMNYSFRELAEDVAAFVGAMGYGRAHIIGHSNGGNVALVTLMEHPEVVQTCILQAANAYVTPYLVAREPVYFDAERIESEEADWMNEMITLHEETNGKEYWRTLVRLTMIETMSAPNYSPEQLSRVTRPVLSIMGAYDTANAADQHAQFIAKHIPNAELWVDVIDNIQPVLKLQQCLDSGTYCNDVQRDSFGTLWLSGLGGEVTALQQNLGSLKTSGIDIGVNYRQPIADWGILGFTFQGTWVQNFETQPLPNGGSYDCVGYYGTTCGQPNPEWRHRFGIAWNMPWNLMAGLTWRYISSVNVDSSSSNPLLTGAFNPPDLEIGSQSYFDLALQWAINKNFSVRGGINNPFDKDPPVVTQTIAGPSVNGNGNTFPGVYDYLGRSIFLGLTAKF